MAKLCRQRGRAVLIGVVGLNLERVDFYKKEITFLSCSMVQVGMIIRMKV